MTPKWHGPSWPRRLIAFSPWWSADPLMPRDPLAWLPVLQHWTRCLGEGQRGGGVAAATMLLGFAVSDTRCGVGTG